MTLTPMRYKDFVWPHNPRTYTIRYERQVAVHKVPFGRYAMQDLGMGRRIMEGEGEFWGPDAYDTFKELASVFYAGGPGTLVHPVWQSASAYLVRLTLTQEPRPDYVRYAFTFWEDFGGYRQGLRVSPGGGGAMATLTVSAPKKTEEGEYHTMLQGETLWGVALNCGTDVSSLLALNPRIANPNEVTAGERVRVR